MRNEPCQIGSIRPRRQALERRTLHPSNQRSPLENNGFHVVYILSRFIHMLFLFAVVSAGLSQWVFNAYKTRETL